MFTFVSLKQDQKTIISNQFSHYHDFRIYQTSLT